MIDPNKLTTPPQLVRAPVSCPTMWAEIGVGLRVSERINPHAIVNAYHLSDVCGLVEQYVRDVSPQFAARVTGTYFVGPSGVEAGVVVGLINYPLRPSFVRETFREQVTELAKHMLLNLHQERVTVMFDDGFTVTHQRHGDPVKPAAVPREHDMQRSSQLVARELTTRYIGTEWQHFKGGKYTVCGFFVLERCGTILVNYFKPLDDHSDFDYHARPWSEWSELLADYRWQDGDTERSFTGPRYTQLTLKGRRSAVLHVTPLPV